MNETQSKRNPASFDQTSYTPGPWETSRDAVPPGHVQITVYAESSGQRVATAFECEANARLIAAAPDLLAALADSLDLIRPEECADYLTAENTSRAASTYRKARAAIAKATGEEQS